MKVRVNNTKDGFVGFYGGVRRRFGDEFPLDDPKHFSESWMEKLEEPKKRKTKGEGAE